MSLNPATPVELPVLAIPSPRTATPAGLKLRPQTPLLNPLVPLACPNTALTGPVDEVLALSPNPVPVCCTLTTWVELLPLNVAGPCVVWLVPIAQHSRHTPTTIPKLLFFFIEVRPLDEFLARGVAKCNV